MTESDPLPNHVCIECWTKIENFHDFYASVRAAQARYLSDLVKYEAESNHFVDVFEPVDLNIDTSNAEPVDVLTLMNDEQHEATMKLEYEICQPTFIDETSTQITHESTEYDEILENDDLENKATEPSEAENETGRRIRFEIPENEFKFCPFSIIQPRNTVLKKSATIKNSTFVIFARTV